MDLDDTKARMHQALDAFFQGDPGPMKALYSHESDATLANPFGPPAVGWDEVEAAMDRAAAHYRDGRLTGFESIAQSVTDQLAYALEIERYVVKIGGADQESPVALRVTTILRPESDGWRVVHRHADPITTPRDPESVIG